MDPNETPFWLKGLQEFAVLSGELMGLVGMGIGLAYLCQRWLGAPSLILILGALGGLTAAIVRLYQRQKKLGQKET